MVAIWRRGLLLLALTLALTLALSLTAEAKVYMVAVGVSDYPGTENDLTLPENDAQKVSWLYGKNQQTEQVILLNSQATCSNILSAMQRLYSLAGIDDTLLFFFAGHGTPSGFVAYDMELSYQNVRDMMKKSSSRNKMIFADSCFSGKMRSRESGAGVANPDIANSNILLFLSSRSDEYASEAKGMDNGYFTTYLVKGLRGGADRDSNRIITARELYDYVSKKVMFDTFGCQHPVMWGKFSDDMPILKW